MNRISPQSECISRSHCEKYSPREAPVHTPNESSHAPSRVPSPPKPASPRTLSAGSGGRDAAGSGSTDVLTRRQAPQAASPPGHSLSLTHPESRCKEVVPRQGTETLSPRLPEQGAKEWRGRGRGEGATLFLETRIQILLLLNPESPPSLPIDQCGG